MVNYNEGKIYKIVCNVTDLVYYGSTCVRLCDRLSGHVSNYKGFLENKPKVNYVTSFKVLENKDYYIELVENVPCNNKDELFVRENYYIKNFPNVNKVLPRGSPTDIHERRLLAKSVYREMNRESINEKRKINYHQNKVTEYAKKRLPIICECGLSIARGIKSSHIKTKNHLLRMSNIENNLPADENIKRDTKPKVSCDCGGSYTTNNKRFHILSKKHLDFFNQCKDCSNDSVN